MEQKKGLKKPKINLLSPKNDPVALADLREKAEKEREERNRRLETDKKLVEKSKDIRSDVTPVANTAKPAAKNEAQNENSVNSEILGLGLGPRRADSKIAITGKLGKTEYVEVGDYAKGRKQQKDIEDFDNSFYQFYRTSHYDSKAAEDLQKQLTVLKEKYPEAYKLNQQRYDAIENALTNTGYLNSKYYDNVGIFYDSISRAINAGDQGGGEFVVSKHVETARNLAKNIEAKYPEQYKADKGWFDRQIKIAEDKTYRDVRLPFDNMLADYGELARNGADSATLRKKEKEIIDAFDAAWGKKETSGYFNQNEIPELYLEFARNMSNKELHEHSVEWGIDVYNRFAPSKALQEAAPNDTKKDVENAKAQQEDFLQALKVIPYERVRENSDFAQKSKYKKKDAGYDFNYATNTYTYDYESGIHYYNLVNGVAQAENVATKNGQVTGDDNWRNYTMVEDDERRVFNYLWETAGKDEALAYIDALMPYLSERRIQDNYERDKKIAQEHPVAASVITFGTKAYNALPNAVFMAADTLANGEVDVNSTAYDNIRQVNTIRGTVEDNIDSGVGKFFYRQGMNIGDNVTSMAAGGFGAGGLASKVITTGIMSAGSFSDTVMDATERGLSGGEAFALGIVSAGSEMFFESKSFESLFDGDTLKKSAWEYFTNNLKNEIAGELGTELANDIADNLIAQDLSNWNLSIAGYMSEGFTKDEAFRKTLGDWGMKYAEVAGGTILSTGVMSGTPAAVSSALNRRDAKSYGESVKKAGNADKLLDMASKFPENTETAKLYSEYIGKEYTAENISELNLGRLREKMLIDSSTVLMSESATLEEKASAEKTVYDIEALAGDISSDASADSIDKAAESAVDKAMAEVIEANTEPETASGTEVEAPALDKNKPTVAVKTGDDTSITVNGEYYGKIDGRTVYVAKGKDIGASEAYYAIDSETGLSLASGETKSVINEKLKGIKADVADFNNRKSSGENIDTSESQNITELLSEDTADTAQRFDFSAIERTVDVTPASSEDVNVKDVDDDLWIGGTDKSGKGSNLDYETDPAIKELIERIRTATPGTKPADTTESGYVPAEAVRYGESVESTPEFEQVKKKVDSEAYKSAFTPKNTQAVSDGKLDGDRLDVGKNVVASDLVNTVLEKAANSGNTALQKEAQKLRNMTFRSTDEMYRAFGGLAKAVGITGEDVIQSRAASIALRYENSVRGDGDTYSTFSNNLRQSFEAAGDALGLQALDYLDGLYEKGGIAGIQTASVDVNSSGEVVEYSSENRNTAVENFIAGMQISFRKRGDKDTRFEVYYDNSENAKRGEWLQDENGKITIRINGAKLRGAESATWVITHELFHTAARTNPGLVKRVIDTFREMGLYDDSKFEAYKAAYEAETGKKLSDDYIYEEIAADLLTDVIGNEKLMQMFVNRTAKEDLNFIQKFFRMMLDGFKKVFGGNKKYQSYVFEADSILGMFERGVKEYDRKKNSGDEISKSLLGKGDNNASKYTDQEYRDFGWARENDIITAGENENYRSKFAMLKKGLEHYPKTKRGEYIIPAYDAYDPELENIESVLVFAKGTIDKPIITSIIRIYSYDGNEIDRIERYIYDCERRGVQPKTGELFDRYDAADFAIRPQISASSAGNSSGDKLHGNGSSSKNNGADKSGARKVEKKFALSGTVEKTPKLIAVHNVRSDKLPEALDLGGLPMPSIAVTKAGDEHSKFGDVSFVFGRETIDPEADKRNKLYGGDAYTPTRPQVAIKIRESAKDRFLDIYYDYQKKFGDDYIIPLYGFANYADEEISRAGGVDEAVSRLKKDTSLMQAYLQMNGKKPVEPVMVETETKMDDGDVMRSEFFVEALGEDAINAVSKPRGMSLSEHLNGYYSKYGDKLKSAYERYLSELLGFSSEEISNVMANYKNADAIKYIVTARNFLRNGSTKVETKEDYQATQEKIREAVKGTGYSEWIDGLFDNIVEKKGIRNNKDLFTPSGKRRSFEDLYYEYNLENIVKAMSQGDKKGISAFGGSIFGASTKNYKTVEDARADASRLKTISDEEYSQMRSDFFDRLHDISERLANGKGSRDAEAMLVEAVAKYTTPAGIKNYLARESKGFYKYTDEIGNEFLELVGDIADMPTEYFEAKPERAVDFSEVKYAVVPDNMDKGLLGRLEKVVPDVRTYVSGNNDSRAEVLNSVPEVRFAASSTSITDTARKKVVKALTALAGQNGVARLDKNEFVTEAMKIVEDVMQTGVVSDSVVEDLARLIYTYSREDSGADSAARSYIDIKSRVFGAGKIYVSDEIKGSIPDYDKFRRQFGTLLSNTESAKHDASVSNVDEVFNDLRTDYPDIFTEDLVGADQLIKIAEIVTDARKYERDGTTVPVSDKYKFDDAEVKNSYIEQADAILDEVADFAGIELVDEQAVYEALREADDKIDATEYPDELYLTKDMTDEQVNELLDKVAKEYPKGSRGYKFVETILSAENNVKNAQKELKSLKNLAKVKDFEVDNKRVVDFTKALANEFGFGGDIAKTAEIGRGLKKLYDSVSEYIKNGDEASLNEVVSAVGDVVYKVGETSVNCHTLVEMKPVKELSGNELSGDLPLNEKIKQLFKRFGGSVHTDKFGDIALTSSSIRSDIRHGTTKEKSVAYEAIPEVLQNGVAIETKHKNNGEVERTVIAAPITISGTPYYMGVMIQRDSNTNRLYLHDVIIKKEASDYRTEHLNTTGPDGNSENLFLTDVLEKAVSVGYSLSQNGKNVNTSSENFIDKLGGYILGSFVGVDKGKTAEFKIPSAEKINSTKSGTVAMLEKIDNVAGRNFDSEIKEASDKVRKATAKLRAQQTQPFFETVLDKAYDMLEEAENSKTEAVKAEKDKAKEKVAAERAKGKERIAKMRENAKAVRERRSERRSRRKQEEKLFSLAKELKGTKLIGEIRDDIDKLFGDIDTIGIKLTNDNRLNLQELVLALNESGKESEGGISDNLKEDLRVKLDRLNQRQIHDLTGDELASLIEAGIAIKKQIANQKFIIGNERRIKVSAASKAGIVGIRNVEAVNSKIDKKTGTLKTKGPMKGKLASFGRWAVTGLLTPRATFRKIFGYDDNNEFMTIVYAIKDGETEYKTLKVRYSDVFGDLVNEKENMREFTGKKAKVIDLTLESGEKISITGEMLVSIAANAKNNDFVTHVSVGGLEIPDIKSYKKGNWDDAWDTPQTVKLTKKDLDMIVNKVSENEFMSKWLSKIQEFYKKTAEDINRTSRMLDGTDKARVKFYFPLTVSSNYAKGDIGIKTQDVSIEGVGMLKERNPGSIAPLRLEGCTRIINRSIEDTARYVGLAIPVRNFNLAYKKTDTNGRSVMSEIRRVHSSVAEQKLERYMSDLNKSRRADYDEIATVFDWVRKNIAKAAMTLNFRVATGNYGGVIIAEGVLGHKAMKKGLKLKDTANEETINKYTPYLSLRKAGGTTVEMSSLHDLDDFTKQNKVVSFATATMAAVDEHCTKIIWRGSEAYVRMNNEDLKIGTDAYYKEVAKVFNETLLQTQASDTVFDTPDHIRSDNHILKVLTSFKSTLMKYLSFLADATSELNYRVKEAGGIKNASKMLANGTNEELSRSWDKFVRVQSAVLRGAIFVAANELLWGIILHDDDFTDEEDKFTIPSMLEGFFEMIVGSYTGSVPLLDEGITGLKIFVDGIRKAKGKEVLFGDYWYGLETPFYDMVNDSVKFINDLSNLWEDVSKNEAGIKSIEKFVIKHLGNAGSFAGAPINNIRIYLVDTIKTGYVTFKYFTHGKSQPVASYYRYKVDEDGVNYYTRQKMISAALKAKKDGDMEAYNAIRKDMIDSKYASPKTFDEGIADLETAIELGTYGDVFKKAAEYDTKAKNVYQRDGSGEAAFRYEVAHHDRYFAENAIELVKDLPKEQQDEKLAVAAGLIRSSDHKKTRGQQLAIKNFEAVGDEGIFKFSAETNEMSKTIEGEKKKADFEFDDYVAYVDEYRDATEYLRLAIFGTDKDVQEHGKSISEKYAGEPWMMYAKDAPADDASAKDKAEYYKKAVSEVQYSILDKYKAKYFKDYGEDYEEFGEIAAGKNVTGNLYTWDKTGENAYAREIYSKADNLIYNSEELIKNLPEDEQDEAMALVTQYAKEFSGQKRKGGELLASVYDSVYGDDEDPDIKPDNLFKTSAAYSNLQSTIDEKTYKADFEVDDYLDYNQELEDADELLRLTLFGGVDSEETKALKSKYSAESWMQLVELAEKKSDLSDKEKLELYMDLKSEVDKNIKLPYIYKYIPEASSGNEYVDDLLVQKDAAYSAYTINSTTENAYYRAVYGSFADLAKKSNELVEDLPANQRKPAQKVMDDYFGGFMFTDKKGMNLRAKAYERVYGKEKDPKLSVDSVFDKYATYTDLSVTVDDKTYETTFNVEDYINYNEEIWDADELASLVIFGAGDSSESKNLKNKYKDESWMLIVDAIDTKGMGDKEKLDLYKSIMSDIESNIKLSYMYQYINEYSSKLDSVDAFRVESKAFSAALKYYKDDDGDIADSRIRGLKNYYDIYTDLIENSLKLINNNPKISESTKERQLKELDTYVQKLSYKPSEGQKLVMNAYEKYGVNEEVYNKKIKDFISRTDDPTLEKLYYDSAQSITVEKTDDNISYTITFSQPDYLKMVNSMDKGQEYAALYVFKGKNAAETYKGTLTESEQAWIDAGYSEYKKDIKKINNLVSLGIISEHSAPAYYYYALTGKIKSAVRASYRESYFTTFKKDANTPKGYYVKYNP